MLHTQHRLSLVRPYKVPFIGWDIARIFRKGGSGHYKKSRGLRDDQRPVLTCWAIMEHHTQTCWAIFLVHTTAGKYRWEAEVLTPVCPLPCYLHQRGSWHKEWRYRQNSSHSMPMKWRIPQAEYAIKWHKNSGDGVLPRKEENNYYMGKDLS